MSNKAIEIAQSYLSIHEAMPPLLIGFDKKGTPLTLIGVFRDFQEQITFCALAKIAFLLRDIKSYHVITHGQLSDKVNPIQIKKAENRLLRFLNKGKDTKILSLDDIEVLIDTHIDKKISTDVYGVKRNKTGNIKDLERVLDFSESANGLFLNLLVKPNVQITTEITPEINKLLEKITYNAEI